MVVTVVVGVLSGVLATRLLGLALLQLSLEGTALLCGRVRGGGLCLRLESLLECVATRRVETADAHVGLLIASVCRGSSKGCA
jgi:hypothetical protein